MRVIQTILFMITITMALTLILTTMNLNESPPKPVHSNSLENKPVVLKRTSRFLQQKGRNANAADHCNKDKEICNYILEGRNTTCCNNKCVDLGYDNNNCGACKNKCAATYTCCRGKSVNLSFDPRHCGFCNNKCKNNGKDKGICVYGMCDYA